MTRFVCPTCDFPIFLRRLGKCEACGAALPAELQLSPRQIEALEAENQRIEKIRNDLAKKTAAELKRKQARRGDGG